MRYYPPRFLFRRYEILKHIRQGEEFLEIGAGNLDLAQDLLNHFDRGTAIDSNPDIAAVYANLSSSTKSHLCLHTEDFLDMAPSLGEYDCVVACEVMEHVKNDLEFLALISDLVKPNGQLILSVPARMKYWSRDDEIAGHFRRYERDAISEAVLRQGFGDLSILSYGFPFTNLARFFRIAWAYQQSARRSSLTVAERTRRIAILRAPAYANLLGLICNRYSIHPLGLIASLFNDLDLSDGYLIVAER